MKNLCLLLIFSGLAFSPVQSEQNIAPSLVVLGTIQDAGSPHAGCTKDCCKALFQHPDPTRVVVSLGLLDPANKMNWLFEATPDLPRQMKVLKELSPFRQEETPNGIFLTHAHIGQGGQHATVDGSARVGMALAHQQAHLERSALALAVERP